MSYTPISFTGLKMPIYQANGTPSTEGSAKNNGGVFLGGIVGNNNTPVKEQQNTGFLDTDVSVATGIDVTSVLSEGTFANDNSRGSIMRATDTIAGLPQDILEYAANNNIKTPVEITNSAVSRFPLVEKSTKNYTYANGVRTAKKNESMRNGNFNFSTGKFADGYPKSSVGYWSVDGDPDVQRFADSTNVSSLSTIRNLVKYLKDENLWINTRFWPMKSTNNTGSGSTVYGLGNLTSYDLTLLNSPTWTSSGIEFDGTNQLGYAPDFLTDKTMTMFWRGTNNTSSAFSIGQYESTDNQRSIAVRALSNGANLSILRVCCGVYANNAEDLWTQEDITTESLIVVTSPNPGSVSVWKNKNQLSYTNATGIDQTKHFNSTAPITVMGWRPTSPLGCANGICSFAGIIASPMNTEQRETITDFINSL